MGPKACVVLVPVQYSTLRCPRAGDHQLDLCILHHLPCNGKLSDHSHIDHAVLIWIAVHCPGSADPILKCARGDAAGTEGLRMDELVQQAQASTIQSVTLSQQEVLRALTQNTQAFELRANKWHLRAAATMS